MKHYEQYAAEINELKNNKFYTDFIVPNILKTDDEDDMVCNAISAYQTLLFLENYEEPEKLGINWNEIPVDTPILVRNTEDEPWLRRYFAKYENGRIHAWSIGRTSWTANTVAHTTSYAYAKLAEEEE